MTLTTTRRMFHALALAGLAATGSLPARAAVIQSTPATGVVFATDLPFVPESRREFYFDPSLGTLNGVTLAFDGTMTVNLATTTDVEPPFPATATANVSVYQGRTVVDLGQIAVPLTFTERPEDAYYPYGVRGSASEARSFEVFIPAERYGSYSAFWTDYRFTDFRPGTYSTFTDAIFRGSMTALFDYTPADGGVVLAGGGATDVPEPASFAMLGLGLAGVLAARRRVT